MSAGIRLSNDDIRDLAFYYLEAELEITEWQASPRAALMTGQSGSGKSTVRAELEGEMAKHGGAIVVDADAMRWHLPYIDELDSSDPNFSAQTQVDAGRLAAEIGRQAVAARRNVIIDGTLRDLESAREIALELGQKGYRTELHALAVNDQVSMVRSALRYERDAAAGRAARLVPQGWHDASYVAVARTVRGLEYSAAVERIVVYNRLGDVVHDAPPKHGSAPAAEALNLAREKLTVFERINIAEHWDRVTESMERRSAPPGVTTNFERALQRAHYTLRSSLEAAQRYDHDYPSERTRSLELADAYGRQLADAFRSNRSVAEYPELTRAYATVTAADSELRGYPPALKETKQKHVRDDVAMCLMQGSAPAYHMQPTVELEHDRLQGRVAQLTEGMQLAREAGITITLDDTAWLKKAQDELDRFREVNAPRLRPSNPDSGIEKLETAAPTNRPAFRPPAH